MSSTQVKKELQNYIEKADDRIIHAMYAMLQSYLQQEDEIVAFTVGGQPLTKKEMLISLDKATSEVEKGNGLTSDDIRKAKKNWK